MDEIISAAPVTWTTDPVVIQYSTLLPLSYTTSSYTTGNATLPHLYDRALANSGNIRFANAGGVMPLVDATTRFIEGIASDTTPAETGRRGKRAERR